MGRIAATSSRRPSHADRLRAGGRSDWPWLASYLERSRGPLASLLFVLPLLILHEIGVHQYAMVIGSGTEYRVAAFGLLMRFFHTFGASGRYLPALTVVAVLLATHVAQRDRWVFDLRLPGLIAAESLAWAAPLVAVFFLLAPTAPTFLESGEWKLMASLYLGAGVYEELIFRLAGFAVLSFVVIDVLRLSRKVATPLIVFCAAIAFSGYHLWGSVTLPWQSLLFIGLRGVYYGIIFLERGFGVTVGVHTAYDLMLLALREASMR
jgi:hypothetical protein